MVEKGGWFEVQEGAWTCCGEVKECALLTKSPAAFSALRKVDSLQGYLAHKKRLPHGTLQ